MKCIACNINMFAAGYNIFLLDSHDANNYKQIATTDLEHLPEVVIAACTQENTSLIKLFGNNTFAIELAEDIVEYAKRNYSNFDIKVEVN